MTWVNGASRSGTATHKAWARAVKRRDHYQCQRCGYQGTPGAGDVVADHKRNHATGGTETLDNGVTLCHPCHAPKTAQEAAQGRARRSPRRAPERHPGLM